MLDAWINTKKIWYALYEGSVEEVDENGDYTGEMSISYSKVQSTRVNLSPARGEVNDDIFGINKDYNRVLSTSKMKLKIDEQTLIWDHKPVTDADGKADPNTAVYKVVGKAIGHYQMRFALKELNVDEAGD